MWNEFASIHFNSDFYDLENFKKGTTSLKSVELEEMGDVAGKSLLHLQCHFGMDTLSWARLGAQVTGVDFSDKAIDLARSLAQELNIPANFVCSDVYKLPEVLSGQFDLVYTSYGVLMWLPDLKAWAKIISHFLKPGGTFYIAEIHPFALIFEPNKATNDWVIKFPYFHADRNEPIKFDIEGSYADREAKVSQPIDFEWVYTMSDVINALLEAGLKLEYLHEFPLAEHEMAPFMVKDSNGYYRLTKYAESVPLLFSIKATK